MSSEARVKAVREAVRTVRGLKPEVLGLGSGSTMRLFIEVLSSEAPDLKRRLMVVPTSHDAALKAEELGFRVLDPSTAPDPDVTVDSADEVDPELNLLKGGGGALTLEKVVAARSPRYIIVVEDAKLVDRLCERHPLPLEVLPAAWRYVASRVGRVLPSRKAALRKSEAKVGPVVTDLGNFLLDVEVGGGIEPGDVEGVEASLKLITGVVEVGLFPRRMVSQVIVGFKDGVKVLEPG